MIGRKKASLQAVESLVMKRRQGLWNQTFCIQNLAPAFISSKLANYFILLCLTFLSCKLEKIVCNQ